MVPGMPLASLLVVTLISAVLGPVPPVPGPVVRPFDQPERYAPGHRGTDLAAVPGEEVRAALPGLVTFAGRVAGRGWVTVRHDAHLDTTYGDLDPRLVAAGDWVEAGQPLGRLAPAAGHLDWGARMDGAYIDPLTLLGRWEVYLVADSGRAHGPPRISSPFVPVA